MSSTRSGSVFVAPVNSTMQEDESNVAGAGGLHDADLDDERETASRFESAFEEEEEDQFTLSDGADIRYKSVASTATGRRQMRRSRSRGRQEESDETEEAGEGYEITNISKMSLDTMRKTSNFHELFGNFIRGKRRDDDEDDYERTLESSSSSAASTASLDGGSSRRTTSDPTTTRKLRILERLCASSVKLDDDEDDKSTVAAGEDGARKSGRFPLNKRDLELIKEELNTIHTKLMNEYRLIQEKGAELKERERKLKAREEILFTKNEIDAKLRFEELRRSYEDEIDRLKEQLKERTRECKRLNQSFAVVKQSNDAMKQQLNERGDRISKLEKQLHSSNQRLANLHKRMELDGHMKTKLAHPSCCNEMTTTAIATTTTTAVIVQQPAAHQTTSATASSVTNQVLTKSAQTNLSTNPALIQNANMIEAFAMLLDWISRVNLRKNIDFSLPFNASSDVLDKCCRLLPLLAELVIHLNNAPVTSSIAASFKKYHLAFLEFIYWALLHFDSSFQNQRLNLSSTFRRIGEELYRSCEKRPTTTTTENYQSVTMVSTLINASGASEHQKSATACKGSAAFASSLTVAPPQPTCLFSLFLQSENPQVRLLSCLIILRTLSQVDYIVNVFGVLRDDLRDDLAKKYFLYYHGTWTVLKWFKLTNKIFLNSALDAYLLLSLDWPERDRFLESCSNENWFSHVSLLFKASVSSTASEPAPSSENFTFNGVDIRVLEKLSIILQKLARIKSNRKFFEMFSLSKVCHELLMANYQHDSDFLKKNLKSILSNLSAKHQ